MYPNTNSQGGDLCSGSLSEALAVSAAVRVNNSNTKARQKNRRRHEKKRVEAEKKNSETASPAVSAFKLIDSTFCIY